MSRFIGETHFLWFFARVTNINDPDMLGQCQIRVAGFHDDVLDENLPWAMPLLPVMSASHKSVTNPPYKEVGISPTGLLVGSFIFGFFADGATAAVPVIVGSMPTIPEDDVKKHDVPEAARQINVWANRPLMGPELPSPYDSKYPYNKVTRTLSGHTIEIDDTPGKERIHLYHKSGTYTEIHPDGTTVTKSVANTYNVVAKNSEVYVEGIVNGKVQGRITLECNNSITVTAVKAINLQTEDSLNIRAQKNVNIEAGSSITLNSPNNSLQGGTNALSGTNKLTWTIFSEGSVGDWGAKP